VANATSMTAMVARVTALVRRILPAMVNVLPQEAALGGCGRVLGAPPIEIQASQGEIKRLGA
jgi:hypothetical protein